jgi:hypothetical protein
MVLGMLGTMVLGVATNLVTPLVRRNVARVMRRSRRAAGRIVRAGRLRPIAGRLARPVRRLVAFVRV